MKQDWEVKKLGEVCDLMTGGTPSRSKPEYFIGGTIKWLVSGDIHKGEIFNCEGRITPEGMDNSSAKYLPLNSVLIALNGQGKTRGTVAMLRTKATCNQSLVSIFPKNISKLSPEYLYCNLHGRYEEIRRITGDSGNDRRGLNMPLIRSLEIPIPPLPEQQRIVAILDECFAAIAKAKANAEHNLKNAKELFDSCLQSVFENKGEGWEEKTLRELTTILGDGLHGTPKYTIEGDYYFINGNNLTDGIIEFKENTKRVSIDEYNKYKKNLTNRTVLVSINGTLGNVAFYNGEKIILGKSACYFNLKENVDRVFIKYVLSSLYFFKYAHKEATGATIKNVSLKTMREFKVPLPSLKEQQRIVQKLDALSAETRKLEAIYQQKINDLEELKKSILLKAFSGELNTDKDIAA